MDWKKKIEIFKLNVIIYNLDISQMTQSLTSMISHMLTEKTFMNNWYFLQNLKSYFFMAVINRAARFQLWQGLPLKIRLHWNLIAYNCWGKMERKH